MQPLLQYSLMVFEWLCIFVHANYSFLQRQKPTFGIYDNLFSSALPTGQNRGYRNDGDLFTASNEIMQKRYSQSNQVNTGPGVTLALHADNLEHQTEVFSITGG